MAKTNYLRVFQARLKLLCESRGGHAVGYLWGEEKRWIIRREAEYMFASGLFDLVTNHTSSIEEGGVVEGWWGEVKRGTATGIVYLGKGKPDEV